MIKPMQPFRITIVAVALMAQGCQQWTSNDTATAPQSLPTNVSLTAPPAKALTVADIKKGMIYAEARGILMGDGYTPVQRSSGSENDDDCGDAEQCKLPETEACSGTGLAMCKYVMAKGSTYVFVIGKGETDIRDGQTVASISIEPNWLRDQIVGTWAEESTNCETDVLTKYTANGVLSYLSNEGPAGTWSLSGTTFIQNFNGGTTRTKIKVLSEGHFSLTYPNGESEKWMRCSVGE